VAQRRSRAWVFAVAAAVVVVAWLLRPTASVEHVLDMRLPTGDHLVGVAGARFDVAELAPAKRRVELHDGTVMFDVAHVVRGQRFEVVTDHLTATAKGTVFSVETDALRSRVRVYEGVVEVEQAGRTHTLLAGALWDSANESTNIAMASPAALAPSIEVALRERAGTVFKDETRVVENRAAFAVTTPPATNAPTNARTAPAAEPPNHSTTPSTANIAATQDVPITAPWSTDSVPLAKLSPTQLLATARADLRTGKYADALDAATLATPWSGAWWQVVADAHRGGGDTAAAADAYDHAAKQLAGADRNEAGYSAAYLRFRELQQNAEALASLDAGAADAAGTPLEERALGLRAQILVALGRRDDAKAIARRYLAQFPHADLRAYMLDLTK